MVKVGVYGHTGRLGIPLVKLLSKHQYAEIVYKHSKSEPRQGILEDAEFIFLALDSGVSEQYFDEWKNKRVIDLSIDHRDKWVYGFPELYRDKIRNAELVANPGCYPTTIISGLYPIMEFVSDISIKAYSGVSGKPNQPVVKDKGIEKYATGREHPHVKEIEMCLGKQIQSLDTHLVYPLETGIVAKIDVEVDTLYENAFCNEPFLKLVNFKPIEENFPYFREKLSDVANTNFCHISYEVNRKSITIISALDNLIKGGSGQAVQNFNIMNDFNETEGLTTLPNP